MPRKKQPKWPADKIQRWPIDKLFPQANNARMHSPLQINQIAASISEWGWTVPVLIDVKGKIIAGHGRILAAQQLGLTEAPVMVAEGWSDAKKRAYAIADNKLADNSDWDRGLLAIEFATLSEKFDLELTGFSAEDLKSLSLDFKPNEDPTFSNGGDVTGGDVTKAKGSLDDKFKNSGQQNLVDVMCPHCGKEFGINRDAI
jgi:hypothetical protein